MPTGHLLNKLDDAHLGGARPRQRDELSSGRAFPTSFENSTAVQTLDEASRSKKEAGCLEQQFRQPAKSGK